MVGEMKTNLTGLEVVVFLSSVFFFFSAGCPLKPGDLMVPLAIHDPHYRHMCRVHKGGTESD